jgi:hypothetical protein
MIAGLQADNYLVAKSEHKMLQLQSIIYYYRNVRTLVMKWDYVMWVPQIYKY